MVGFFKNPNGGGGEGRGERRSEHGVCVARVTTGNPEASPIAFAPWRLVRPLPHVRPVRAR
jgi:hypothetical protein